MNSVNFSEILVVNSIGIVLMAFLQLTRIENKEKRLLCEKIFDVMIWLTMAGCFIEILTFVFDGKIFPGCRILSYVLNSACFIGTCSVGFLWVMFVDLRVFNSVRRARKRAGILVIPLAADILMNLFNLSGCGIVFSIAEDNVYSRGKYVVIIYLILFFYYIYSICLVDHSKRNSLHVRFFPTSYFVIPCMAGTIVQGIFYGITVGWTSVAMAFVFVYIQMQALNIFEDSLSGLYNRRYMDCILSQAKRNARVEIFGIMIDVNDFKQINDVYGHSKGDQAIQDIGSILSDSVPNRGLAIRYAGDEFIILLRTDDEKLVKQTISVINQNVEEFNRLKKEPYTLSFAVGYSRFDSETGSIEEFLSEMDREMYRAKQKHYELLEKNKE